MHPIVGHEDTALPDEHHDHAAWLWLNGKLEQAPTLRWVGGEPEVFDAGRDCAVVASQHPAFVATIVGTPEQNAVEIASGLHRCAGEAAASAWLASLVEAGES
jgi:hypothetical protein